MTPSLPPSVSGWHRLLRSRTDRRGQSVTLLVNDQAEKKKNYLRLLPSEMETLTVTPKEKVRSLQLKMEARQ